MADVTGNIGNESVRLRGMALEDTQYRMQQDIEDLLDVTKAMAQKQGANLGQLNTQTGRLGQALAGAAAAAGAAGAQSGKLGGLLAKLNSGGQKFEKVIHVVGGLTRILRNMDSNINDASYTMRSLGANIRGPMGKFIEYTANSVSQLEDQFQVYKRLSSMGGAVADDFDNLRENAARTGVTMQEYAGLVAENYNNLRLGGRSVRNTMENLTKGVESLIDDQNIPYIMQRLGISTDQYGKVMLQQTALMGGFSKVYKDQGSNFNNSLLRAVKTTTLLSEAFGAQRDQIMEALNEASRDAIFAQQFENLLPEQKEVKNAVFQAVSAMGLSPEEAKQLTISMLSDVPTPFYTEMMAAGGEPILNSIRTLADRMQADPANIDKIMKPGFEDLKKKFQDYAKEFGNEGALSRFFADPNSPLKRGTEVLLGGARRFATEGIDAIITSTTNYTGENKKNIDTLLDVQKQNIKLAITAAKANVALNAFGLTAATGVQLLTQALVGSTGTVIGELGNTSEFKDLQNLMREYTKTGNDSLNELQKDLEKLLKTEINLARSGANPPASGGNGSGSGGNRTTTGVADGVSSQQIQVKTAQGVITTMPISDLDARGGQATAAGPTPTDAQNLIAAVFRLSNDFQLTAVRDKLHQDKYPNSAHNKGNAIDITIENGSAADYKKRTEDIQRMLENFGLKAGSAPGKGDFYLQNEHPVSGKPSPGSTGPHIHLELTNPSRFSEQFQRSVDSLRSNQNSSQSSNGSNQTSSVSGVSSTASSNVLQSPAVVNNSNSPNTDTILSLSQVMGDVATEIRTMRISIQNLETTMERAVS
jgi:hypothetical protein